MKMNRPTEKGQILVLLILAMMGLLGFTALAVDGGMIYADRRYAQSAADASSLAGAGTVADVVQDLKMDNSDWDCGELASGISAAYQAAIEKASSNDFSIAKDDALGTTGHDNGVKVICNASGKYLDVYVMLSKVSTTAFVHLFNGGEMRNTVSSTTRVKPILKAGNGASIVSLGKVCDKQDGGGVHFDSGSLVTILTGGGVYSNSCVFKKNQADVTIDNGGVTCHTGFACDITDPTPIKDPSFHPLTDHELYPGIGEKCSKTDPYVSSNGGGGEINPGNYSSWTFKDPVHLKPGLYCVKGTVKMDAGGEVYGDGVTIYYTGTDLTINGHAESSLTAANTKNMTQTDFETALENGAVENVLLYVPPNIVADIKINGTSDNTFGGTLYAPSSHYKITGASSSPDVATTMNCSIIGETVWVSGTSYINISYDSDLDAGWPAYIQVQK